MYIIELEDFGSLLSAIRKKGFTTIGPMQRDGAIVLDEISTELPQHYHDEQSPGAYSVSKKEDAALFDYNVGPDSWKKFLSPPRVTLSKMKKNGKGFSVETPSDNITVKHAFIGLRPCDLHAIAIQDNVFTSGTYVDPTYNRTRKQVLIVAVNCTRPGGNCFCASMETGPRAVGGFDLCLTEIVADAIHHFTVEVGSAEGESIMRDVTHRPAEQVEVDCAIRMMANAANNMGKVLDTTEISRILNDNFEHQEWDDIARRCLACTNCTMVCPTCFCSTVEDVTDLTGEQAERRRRWDSCFTSDFTKIAGGNIRMSTRTRYRQWMMHKFAHWQEQFGTSGCVGCGRCITWCPVGIDVTREAAIFRESSLSNTKS